MAPHEVLDSVAFESPRAAAANASTAFFDRNFPRGLAQALRAIACTPQRKVEVISHDEWFEQDTPDTVWIPRVAAASKPFVVGGDGAILNNPAEAQALKEGELTYFVLASGFTNLTIHD